MNNQYNNTGNIVPNQNNNNNNMMYNRTGQYSNPMNSNGYNYQSTNYNQANYSQSLYPQNNVAQSNTYQQPIQPAQSSYPQPAVQPVNYTQQTSAATQPQRTYAQQTNQVVHQQVSYPQTSTNNVVTNMSYQQPVQPTQPSYPQTAAQPVNYTQQTYNSIPDNSTNMEAGINEINVFGNNSLPVESPSNIENKKEDKKKNKLSIKKLLILVLVALILVVAITFGLSKLKSRPFGHGYSVEEGNKIDIKESTASKTNYNFTLDILEVKELVVGKTKYKGYKLNIKNNSVSKLLLDGFDVEFTLSDSNNQELSSTTVFLSNNFIKIAPKVFDNSVLPIKIDGGKEEEGYIYFRTNSNDIDKFNINVYKKNAGVKATYTIDFKDKEEAEDGDEDIEEEPTDDESDSEEEEKNAE